MAISASSITPTNSLEDFRIEFNNLVSDVTSISGANTFNENIIFEGATADAYETTLTVIDPTADRTVTIPNLTGTVSLITATETLTNKTLTTPTITAGVAATSFDMNGTELILDADADTSITADTDDQIDIRIAGADDFQFTANTFTAQSGSTIAAQALTATTGIFSSDVTGLTINATGDTAASDNAAIGYTSAEGLILTGQGSTNDVTIKNDADADVIKIPTGTTNVTIVGDLTVTGDDIVMGTNTDTAILVADGTNFNPVVPSGDVSLTNAGVFGIASGVIVNADVNSSAAIADSKLATISTANKVALTALDLDGGTEIGAAIVDADLFIIDDGASGTNKKVLASRLKTYAGGSDPSSADGDTLGTASLEWSDLYLADGAVIYFGADQEVTLTHNHDTSLTCNLMVAATTFEPTGDTSTGDSAALGYTSVLGAILTGQGSTNDVTLVNDADATVLGIATGTTNVDIVGDLTAGTLNADGDTAADDNATIGYTAAEGLILTGQGSTDDITVKNDADTTVLNVATGGTDVEISAGNLLFGTADKGVYLGVTSATAANLLDDYEEGTYTATLIAQSSGGYNLDSGADLLSYTKIGRLVYVTGNVSATSESGTPSGQLRLSLPFTILAGNEESDIAQTRGAVAVNHADGPAAMDDQLWLVEQGTAFLAGYWFTHATGALDGFNHDDVDTAFQIHVNIQYHAA